jgi:Icc-related predicted phosphoesterase
MAIFGKGKSKDSSSDTTDFFYASDVHGSSRCWNKFLNAGEFYKVKHLVMGGDLTGKAIVPIQKNPDGSFVVTFAGETVRGSSTDELDRVLLSIRHNGMYPWEATPEEIEHHRNDPKAREELFETVMLSELKRWVDLADAKAEETGVSIYGIAGNDDSWECDRVLGSGKHFQLAEDRVVRVGPHEMIACSYSSPTPWKSPRELDEESLYQHFRSLAEQVESPETAIFMLHVPPYNSGLDQAREVNYEDLTVVIRSGQPNEIPVGSTAVRQIIEEYQPLLALHGHIHESRGVTTIGRTTCINAGSDYTTGRLHGAVVKLTLDKVVGKQLVIG